MITHEQLITVIETKWPQLVHGRDYLVAHPIDLKTGEHCGDAWIMRWEVTDPPEPDIKSLLAQASLTLPTLLAKGVRIQRDVLLGGSDWTQQADAPLTAEQKTAWQAYRQALRDLPKQSNWPNVNWPEKPA